MMNLFHHYSAACYLHTFRVTEFGLGHCWNDCEEVCWLCRKVVCILGSQNQWKLRQMTLCRSRDGKKWGTIAWWVVILLSLYLNVCCLNRIKLVLSPPLLLNYYNFFFFFLVICNSVSYETLFLCLHLKGLVIIYTFCIAHVWR